ncbi:hypothetical protein [Bacillus suaedaesalsae]|uniref:Aldehyde-activating protein n=1 Tax=Bacillus suaedaesalsae TaxID=2810349 RepID=A0ABS2DD13_9BACI|nr:hypothetical protein [Bacillus suaedaesalsae]MBM6616337.1 hypothetical protein [Bacillus suaedaesalsae]
MKNSKCERCNSIGLDFKKRNYLEAFQLMREHAKQGNLTFVAGSCPLDNLEEHIETEDLYTIDHYFSCSCGQVFYTGFCIRGLPTLRLYDSLPKGFDKTISGRYGIFFEKEKPRTWFFK